MKSHHPSAVIFQRSTTQVWIGALLGILCTAVFEYAGLLGWLRTGVEFTSQPLRTVSGRAVATLQRPLEFLRVATRRYTYVLDLELRYAETVAKLGELEKLRKENQELRAVLEGTPSAQRAMQRGRRFASILSYAQPTIDVGTAQGLNGDELVFVAGTCIGKVHQLAAYQAQVKLLNSLGDQDVILAKTESGVAGVITGNNTSVLLQEIPIEATVQVGQRVETTGQLGVSAGLYIGRVEEVIRREGAPTQQAVIDQGVSFFRSTVVEVGL
jgi:cell shape-determining protein MreC